MVLLGFYNDSSFFHLPLTSIHAGARDDRHCERENAHGGGTREDRSTTNFGHVRVQIPATGVAAETTSPGNY